MADEAETTQTDENPEVEVVVDGEETPAHQVPSGVLKRINKLNRRNADSEAEVARLRQENELLKLAQRQTQPVERPNRMNFETDDAYEAALDTYIGQKAETTAKRIVDERLTDTDESRRLADREAAQDRALHAHYERATKLNVPDFDDAEDAAVEILGQDAAREIITSLDKSELVLYHLGKNTAKAQEIARLLKTNPVKATVSLGRLEAELKIRPKLSNAPEPETKISGGSDSVQDSIADKLDSLLDQVVDGKMSMDQYRDAKKALEGAD